MKQLFSVFSFFVLFIVSAQTTLTRDSSFGINGSFDVPTPFSGLWQLTFLSDGSALALSENTQTNQNVIIKITPTGFLDNSFGNNGAIVIPTIPEETLFYFLAQNQKIILVYSGEIMGDWSDANAYRYNSDGTLDTTFGENGILYGPLNVWNTEKPLLLLEDNSLLEIKYDRLVKYTEDGQKDLSYGTNGEIETVNDELSVPYGISNNLIYKSNASNTFGRNFSFFNYENPSENTSVNYSYSDLPYSMNGSIGYINSIKLTSDKKTYILGYDYYISSPNSSVRQVLFVLDNTLALDSNFNGDGKLIKYYPNPTTHGAQWRSTIHTFEQFFIASREGIFSYDNNGIQQQINGSNIFTDNDTSSFEFLFAHDNALMAQSYTKLVKYNIASDSSTTDCTKTSTWDGLAWDNGYPDINTAIILKGELNLTNDTEACQLKIITNGKLNVPSGLNITILGDVISTNANSLTIQDGGSLVQLNDDAQMLGLSKVSKSSQPMKRLDYTLWSSPVTLMQARSFSPETLTNRIYTYEGESGYENIGINDRFESGKGYLFRAPNNWSETPTEFTGTFEGKLNNGVINVYTYINNLTSIGNPYPSNLDADLFLQTNPIVSTLYFWTNPVSGSTGNNYATYTILGGAASGNTTDIPNGIISIGQGFIVDNNSSELSRVVFNNNMRVTNSAIFFKEDQTEKHRIWLNLNNEENENLSQALVGYMNGATNEVDTQIDGKLFGNEGSTFYSIINEEKFAIQGRSLPFKTSDIVKIGFKAVEAGKFNISLSNFDGLFAEGNVIVYLKDNALNITHNLMESNYNFESIAGEFNDRFEIVYQTDEVMDSEDVTSNSIQIYTQNKNIIINSKSEKILSVELYDLSGRNIFKNENVSSNYYEFKSITKGIVVIKVMTANGKLITKKLMIE